MPQSGVYKTIGDELTNGFQLFLSGAGNQLGGRRVTVVIRDEGETAESGAAAVQQLIKQDQVTVLSGVASSATMAAIQDMVESAQIPLIGSNASPTTLQGVKYIWRTSYVNTEPGQAIAKYLATQRYGGAVALIAADYQAGHDEVEGFRNGYGPTDDDPIFTPFTPSPSTNFGQYLGQIKSSGAKAVFAFYAGAQATESSSSTGSSG